MEVSLAPHKPYSKMEQVLLSILKARRDITTTQLEAAYYRRRERPKYSRQSILYTLDLLSKKIKQNREPFRICKTERRGPYPVTFKYQERK